MTRHARAERIALCDTLESTGPDVPTLCEGWSARDLAAHLVVRERRPDAQVGMFVPPLAAHTESVQSGVASKAWPDLVEEVREGPPAWHPARIAAVDEATNTAEFFIHHEDVRRAQPDWQPRDLSPDLERALWRVCRTMGRFALRRSPVGVELVAPGYGRAGVRNTHPTVRVEGAPGELLLFVSGRREVAKVTFDGPNQAVEQLRATRSGL